MAEYGEHLLENLSFELKTLGISYVGRRQLYLYLTFYRAYPELVRLMPPQLLLMSKEMTYSKDQVENKIVRTVSAQSQLPPETHVNMLSFSHFELLIGLDSDLARRFYEVEALNGRWSVRELRRQISSLLFERTGLTTDRHKLAELIKVGHDVEKSALTVRDPYVFEFLGIKPREVMSEDRLEEALLDKVQEFLLELGHGFCFEARQKRILIGDELFFVDLVFYHRILKCHILCELKVNEFSHEHLGQLNTYVNWYRKNEMTEGDSPPIGILMCTRKNHALIEYALAGLDNQIFVSRYQMELPKKEEIIRFFEDELKDRDQISKTFS